MPQVYLLGKTYLSNNDKFYIRNDSIVQMAVGDRHSIILTGSGRAYAFGDNKSGRERMRSFYSCLVCWNMIRSIRSWS